MFTWVLIIWATFAFTKFIYTIHNTQYLLPKYILQHLKKRLTLLIKATWTATWKKNRWAHWGTPSTGVQCARKYDTTTVSPLMQRYFLVQPQPFLNKIKKYSPLSFRQLESGKGKQTAHRRASNQTQDLLVVRQQCWQGCFTVQVKTKPSSIKS